MFFFSFVSCLIIPNTFYICFFWKNFIFRIFYSLYVIMKKARVEKGREDATIIIIIVVLVAEDFI